MTQAQNPPPNSQVPNPNSQIANPPIPNPQSAIRNRRVWLLLLLALLPTIGALDTPFLLDYDDWWVVSDNPVIQKGWAGLSDLAAHPLAHDPMQLAYRVVYFSTAIDQALVGDWAGGHRLLNALWHGLSALLLFRVGCIFLRSGPLAAASGTSDAAGETPAVRAGGASLAFVAALLFTVHPITVESVAWVIQRHNLLAQFFCLAALVVYLGRAEQAAGTSWRRVALAVPLMLLAQLSKSSAVGFWFVFAAVEALWFQDRWWRRALRAGLIAVPWLVGVGIALASQLDYLVPPLGGDPILQRVAATLHLHGRAWALALWPFHLSAFYHVSPTVTFDGWAAAGLLIPAGMVLLYHVLGLGWRRGLLLVIWVAANLGPNMNPFCTRGIVLQDRYLYLALPGIVMLAVQLVGAATARWTIWQIVLQRMPWHSARLRLRDTRLVPAAAALGAAFVLGGAAVVRSFDWRSEPRLFRDATVKQPHSAFGHVYLAQGLCFHATKAPGTPPAGMSAAGWQARADFLRAEYARVVGAPGATPAELQRAMLERALQEHAEALTCSDYDRLIFPLHHLAEYARTLLLFKRTQEASQLYHRIWEGRPERPMEKGTKLEAVRFLAVEALQAKRFDEGLHYIEEGLKLQPGHPELLANKLLALEDAGRLEEARTEARRLLGNPATAEPARQALKRLDALNPKR
ncbi:MAG: hypothetical protein NTW87_01990 [Planctomycetota bacterium]|nr:hypothetical protein [Planctomycetota bacterium]